MEKKNYGKKIFRFTICIVLLFVNIMSSVYIGIFNPKTVIAATTENTGTIRWADPSTAELYKSSESSSEMGGRYNGRVWTDKSVYSHDANPTVQLDGRFNISYDDDFLTVFSALGSSQSIKNLGALDVSIIMDVSGSMATDVVDGATHNDSETRIKHSRIQLTVDAINTAIDTLMSSNPRNRVCVIAYGGTAYTLMELGHYAKVSGYSTYITVEDFTTYAETAFSTSGGAAYTLRAKAMKNGVEINRSIRNNYTNSVPDTKEKTVDACIGYSTDMQAGIYLGFKELYDNAATDIIRIPTAIIMTDGASNYALKSSSTGITGNEWTNIPLQTSLPAYNTSYKKYRTETNSMDRGGKETILDILMTASYMKVKVQKKYEDILNKSELFQYADSLDFKVHALTVDTKTMVNNASAKWQVPRIYSTLNPEKYFKEDLPDETWDFKQDSINAYALYEQWVASSTGCSSTFKDSDNTTINFKLNKLTNDPDVTNEEIIANINYTDSFSDIESGNLGNVFNDIIANTTFNPIGDSENDAHAADALSYIDPIGKYMEIKDVKKLLLFGQEYNIIKDGNPIVENKDGNKVSKQYYKAVGPGNADLEIPNLSYDNNLKFKLSEIKIWREVSDDYDTGEWDTDVHTDFDESMNITIPSGAIPIHLDTIELDELNRVKEYESNKDTVYALPIRILYTVGISNKIIDQTTKRVDLTKLSREYFTERKEEIEEDGKKKTYIYFFSNYYSKEKYSQDSKTTSGNAAVTFVPSLNNRFYVFQKNLTLYQNSSGGDGNGEGETNDTGGPVSLTNPATDINQIRADTTYYFKIDYYIPEPQSDGSVGRYVQYAIARKGSDFYGADGEKYITYYDTEQKKVVNDKGPNVVVATKKGARRVGNLKNLSVQKENNVTNTAALYYAPTYGNVDEAGKYSIINYLGNNGKVGILTTEILITKTVDNSDKEHYLKAVNQEFNFRLIMDGRIENNNVIIYKCKWNSSEWLPNAEKTYVITNNAGYILYADGEPSKYWVGNDKETQRLVGDDGKMTVYDSNKKDNPQIIDIYKDKSKTESDYKLYVEMQTEKLEFVDAGEGKITTTFTLRDGEGMLLLDIASGTNYTVTEEGTDNLSKGFKFLSVNGETSSPTFSGTTEAGRTARVEYINKYTETLHDLKISKTVAATAEEKKRDWTFDITLTPTKDIVIFDSYNYEGLSFIDGISAPGNGKIDFSKNEDGTYTGTISLKHGQAINIKGLAEEITYKITEKNANINDYTTTYRANDSPEVHSYVNDTGVTGDMLQDQKVDFINSYPVVDFEFTKVASEDNEKKLSGAEFLLYELVCTDETHTPEYHDQIIDTKDVSSCWTLVGNAVSGKTSKNGVKVDDGKVIFEDLNIGIEYRLIEKKATFNRIKPVGQWQIKYSSTGAKPTIKAIGDTSKTPAFIDKDEQYLLPNMQMFQLPISGGNAFLNLIFIGGGLIFIYIAYRNILVIKKGRRPKTRKIVAKHLK